MKWKIEDSSIVVFNMYSFQNKGVREGDSPLHKSGVSQIVPLLCHKLGIPSPKYLL